MYTQAKFLIGFQQMKSFLENSVSSSSTKNDGIIKFLIFFVKQLCLECCLTMFKCMEFTLLKFSIN